MRTNVAAIIADSEPGLETIQLGRHRREQHMKRNRSLYTVTTIHRRIPCPNQCIVQSAFFASKS